MKTILMATCAGALVLASCKPVYQKERSSGNTATAAAEDAPMVRAESANLVRVYVSAVNCEMNVADAVRLNAMANTPGLDVEVVFSGIAAGDSVVLRMATADLGLTVPARIVRALEMQSYKSIGGARLPMAVVIKARQLKTLIAGESMPRTLSLLETAMSPSAGP